MEFPDREAARNWLIDHQISRRNLTVAGASYLRGKRYLAEKGKWGGDRKSEAPGSNQQTVGLISDHTKVDANTERRLADEFRVSTMTIRRDAAFAAAVDTLAQSWGEAARTLILSGDARLTRHQAARMAQLPADEQKRQFEAFQKDGRWPTVPRPAKRTLPLDAEPATLARTLWDQLGRDRAGLVYHHLATLIRG